MHEKGILYLDLIGVIIISSIFIPILVTSLLHLSHLHSYLASISDQLILIKNNINSISATSNSTPERLILNSFHLFKDTSLETPIFWIHSND
tara:strand:+ start:27 stop:302 length:276 start_codon:yes stop_codon:yes gene_type:complete